MPEPIDQTSNISTPPESAIDQDKRREFDLAHLKSKALLAKLIFAGSLIKLQRQVHRASGIIEDVEKELPNLESQIISLIDHADKGRADLSLELIELIKSEILRLGEVLRKEESPPVSSQITQLKDEEPSQPLSSEPAAD